MEKYTNEGIDENLKSLQGWKYNGQALEKDFKFKNFLETFAFMTLVALLAEKNNHHPDWKGGYNTLNIQLSSHDAGGITSRDFTLASQIDSLKS